MLISAIIRSSIRLATAGLISTIPIPSNSPARNNGTTDTRGLPRNDGHPDIGAYEVQ